MVLAAGRGERMRPLTDSKPKPLLEVGGRPLIEHHLIKLAAAGFKRIVINHAHLGEQIVSALGNGERWNITIQFSAEPEALETAGGIANALALINSKAFAVVNSDVFSDYDYAGLKVAAQRLLNDARWLAHLVLVDNPEHNPAGDFALQDGIVEPDTNEKLTFGGLAAYRADMFAALKPGEKKALGPILKTQVKAGRVSGEHYHGSWTDVGTRERLAHVNQLVARRQT
ncbi:MAG: nucleotidyltransferase family protein [Betaproteobacteria bacterium]|nr:MAG: nucleotidyltransferase family protein [Betaproteobacteria bacterium]